MKVTLSNEVLQGEGFPIDGTLLCGDTHRSEAARYDCNVSSYDIKVVTDGFRGRFAAPHSSYLDAQYEPVGKQAMHNASGMIAVSVTYNGWQGAALPVGYGEKQVVTRACNVLRFSRERAVRRRTRQGGWGTEVSIFPELPESPIGA
ncbi:MAG: hypothetical protein KAI66_18280 [Lentisphaeria bacterium]|nr:hypothetical protein [Lentisphaeria bacterium]